MIFDEIKLIDFRKPLAARLEARKFTSGYTWAPTAPGKGRGFYQSSKGLEMDPTGSTFALRLELAHKVEDVPREVRDCLGFYVDDFQDQTMIPIIARLPHSRGFLAGWTYGEGMCACVGPDVYDSAREAAIGAHRMAEIDAERERDYQREERAKLEAEERAAEARSALGTEE